MKLFAALLVFIGFCVVVQSEKISYENYRVYSIQLDNEEQLKVLQTIERYHPDMQFFTPPSIKIATDVAIPPWKLQNINTALSRHEIRFDIKTENLQRYYYSSFSRENEN